MNNRKPRLVWQILSARFLTFLLVFPILAQDPNPDSPTPILISEPDSTRALVDVSRKFFGRQRQRRLCRIQKSCFL